MERPTMRTVLARAVGLLDCWARLKIGSCSPSAPCPACLVAAEAEALLAVPTTDPARGEEHQRGQPVAYGPYYRAAVRVLSRFAEEDNEDLVQAVAGAIADAAPAPPSREAVLLLGHEFKRAVKQREGDFSTDYCIERLGPMNYCGKPASAHTITPVKAKCSPVKIATGTICGEHHAIWPCPAATPGEGK